MIAVGADAQSVSLLATLVNLGLSVICIKAPMLIEKVGLGKKGALTLAFLNLCSWVPLALAFLIADIGITPAWFAFLWMISIMPAMLLSIQRDNWLSNLVPKESLGRYLGQRLAIKSAAYLGAFCFLGYLLDDFKGNTLLGFGFIFTVAVVVSLVDFIIFTYMHEPPEIIAKKPKKIPEVEKFKLFEYFRELKEKKLGTFVSFTSLFYLSVGLSGPLYAVYMIQELKFTYLSFTVIVAVEFFARIVSSPLWGRMADQRGNIMVLGIVTRVIPLLPILWLFSSNFVYLAMVQSISGICWGAYDLCTQGYLYKVAPPEKKLRYIVYTRSLMMLATAVGGLLGAYAVQAIFPVFGSKLLSVFLLSGVIRAIVALKMMPKLVDLAINFKNPFRQFNGSLSLGRAATSKRGMFYRRQNTPAPGLVPLKEQKLVIISAKAPSERRKWTEEKKAKPVKKEDKHFSGSTAPQWGLLQQPDVVTVSAETMSKVRTIVPKTNKVQKAKSISTRTVNKRMIDNRRELKKVDRKTAKKSSGTNSTISKRSSSHGLYYNSEGWSRYMRESMKDIMMDCRARKPSKKSRTTING